MRCSLADVPTATATSPDDLRRYLAVARRIGSEVSALLLTGHRRARSLEQAREKGRSDLVTEHDERAEALVRARLADLLPEHGLVGEEGASVSGAEGPDGSSLVWHVDPIDGTSNFAHGHPFFCFAMGLAVRRPGGSDRPILGLVTAPAMGITWAGGLGLGAERNGEPCRVSQVDTLDRALMATGFPASRASDPDNNYETFLRLDAASHGVRRCGAAAMEIALVADGSYDAFWDLGLKSWDVCAGAAIVEAAGGVATGLDGSALELGARRVVLSNGVLHDGLLAALGGRAPLPPLTPALETALKTPGRVG
jgi:myo-inositol-1(or 4)-monophosphatase